MLTMKQEYYSRNQLREYTSSEIAWIPSLQGVSNRKIRIQHRLTLFQSSSCLLVVLLSVLPLTMLDLFLH